METVDFSEMLVPSHQAALCHVSQDCNIKALKVSHCCFWHVVFKRIPVYVCVFFLCV
jgi:hypothetical protein